MENMKLQLSTIFLFFVWCCFRSTCVHLEKNTLLLKWRNGSFYVNLPEANLIEKSVTWWWKRQGRWNVEENQFIYYGSLYIVVAKWMNLATVAMVNDSKDTLKKHIQMNWHANQHETLTKPCRIKTTTCGEVIFLDRLTKMRFWFRFVKARFE